MVWMRLLAWCSDGAEDHWKGVERAWLRSIEHRPINQTELENPARHLQWSYFGGWPVMQRAPGCTTLYFRTCSLLSFVLSFQLKTQHLLLTISLHEKCIRKVQTLTQCPKRAAGGRVKGADMGVGCWFLNRGVSLCQRLVVVWIKNLWFSCQECEEFQSNCQPHQGREEAARMCVRIRVCTRTHTHTCGR